MNLSKKPLQIKPALIRHIAARNSEPYERILQYIRKQKDIWIVSQGEYMEWWVNRSKASLRINVINGLCHIRTDLEGAVMERFPGEFFSASTVPCENTDFSGDIWITIDSKLKRKELLIEILKREGILNYQITNTGDFVLSGEALDPLLEQVEASVSKRRGKFWEADIYAIRQIIIDKLARHNLPLLRVWYHPLVDNIVMKAVFSPRYDVDRAITNLAHIRAIEQKYNVPSTLYLRAFCPFYMDRDVKELVSKPWCSEIVLHGEFVTNARKYGDELNAAHMEKRHLEQLIGRPVLGVGMHGGELTNNRSKNTDKVIDDAGFLYDTTPRPAQDFLPSRKAVNGHLGQAYTLSHALGDIEIPANRNYAQQLYERTVAKMDEIYQKNGIFVFMLHPAYFGFFAYLSKPKNWIPLLKFSLQYFKQALQH
jgi:hypothetical protein